MSAIPALRGATLRSTLGSSRAPPIGLAWYWRWRSSSPCSRRSPHSSFPLANSWAGIWKTLQVGYVLTVLISWLASPESRLYACLLPASAALVMVSGCGLVRGRCSGRAAARTALATTFLVVHCLLAIPDDRNASTYWSPYQKLTKPDYSDGQLRPTISPRTIAWFQKILNLSPAFVQSHPARNFIISRWNRTPTTCLTVFILPRRQCWCWARAWGTMSPRHFEMALGESSP